jgi:6-pyruvoyltetrahydropterin/6-carboxytetrahydropterin synthase
MADVLITRRFDFSASHRYYRPEWSEEENARVFGLCALPNGHGHNYTLEVSVAGEPDTDTGMVINLVDLKAAVDGVLVQFDHKHLNLDTPYFQDAIPTTENLAAVLWRLIDESFQGLRANGKGHARLARMRLHEADDLFVEYYGESA